MSCCVNVRELILCKLVLPDLQSGEMDPKTFAKSLRARRECSKQIKTHKHKVSTLLEIICKKDSKNATVGKRLEQKQYDHLKVIKLKDLHVGLPTKVSAWLNGGSKDRTLLYHLDKLMSVLLALKYCANVAQFVSILNLYLGIYYDESIIQNIFEYFESLFGISCKQDEVLEHQSDTFATIKQLLGNWEMIQHSEAAQKMYKFISMILTVGMCKINGISFSLGGLAIFHMEAEKKVYALKDIVEVCLTTAIYFYERGCDAFTNKDPWRLFYSDDTLLLYEHEFAFLIASGPLVEVNNWDELGCTAHEFEKRLNECYITTSEMVKGSPVGTYRNVLNGKLLSLQKMKTKLAMSKRNVSMRVKPFAVLFYGKTGVGKSTMLDYVNNYLSKINDFPVGPEYKCSLNPSDQYDSSYSSTAITVIMDDIANATFQATTGNPCLKIIDFINNDPKDALKADVDSKGNVKIQPKFVFGTTNKLNLDAYQYSNEPASILRRFDYVVTVAVKDEYQKEDSAQLDGGKMPQNCVPDVWNFCVETVVPIPSAAGGPDGISFKVLKVGDMMFNCVGMKDLLNILGERSKVHFEQQDLMLKTVKDIHKLQMCNSCNNYVSLCGHDQLVHQIGPARYQPWKNIKQEEVPKEWYEKIQDKFDYKISSIPLCPRFLLKMEERQAILCKKVIIEVFWRVWKKNKILALALFIPLILLYCILVTFISPWVYIPMSFVSMCLTIDYKMSFLSNSLIRTAEKTVLYKIADRHRASINMGVKIAGYGVFSYATLITIRSLYRNYKRINNLQGSECIMPVPHDNEKINVWKKSMIIPPDFSEKSMTTTFEQLQKIVSGVVGHVTGIETQTGRHFVSDIFPVGRNVWLMNGHAIRDHEMEVEIIIHSPEYIGGNFKAMISPAQCVHVPDSDLVFIYLPAGGDKKNLRDYMPDKYLDINCEAALVYKNPKGEVDIQKVFAGSRMVEVGNMQCAGYAYTTKKPTFGGQCMSVLIGNLRHPIILGFHFAGSTGTRTGAATYITKTMVDDAYSHLSKMPGVQLSVNSGTFELQDLGGYKNVKLLGKSHSKCPTQFMTDDGTFRNYGSHDGPRRNFSSEVVETVISSSVARVMGVERQHGPPKLMNSYVHWNRTLKNFSQPHNLNPTLISLAVRDIFLSVLDKVHTKFWDVTSPLNDVAILSGADGVYGIDSINLASSAGHPINISKNKILIRSNEPCEGASQPVIGPEWFWAEVSRSEDVLAEGERVYFVFKSHLKDEATKFTKDKVRHFSGSTIVMLALVRKYFLPLCKIIMENPYLFECAVGINAHGPEWDTFTKKVTKFGKNRMVAGDYKDYDATMPASITMAGFQILIEMARRCGYSERQLKIMEGLATEICYPIYEFNGSFIGVQGSNPSGHPLTVFLNSFANSIYLRYAYYFVCDFKPDKFFNDYVALQCYGDDNILSVSEEIPEFNHTSIADALSVYHVTYTMADKGAKSIPYINLSECSFLKRGMVYNQELDLYLGPLEESSLFKTLHCVLKSDVLNPRQQAAECIKCTLQEWFLHGKDKYDLRRDQLLEVIRENDMGSCFDNDLPTYEESLFTFKEKYLDCNGPTNPVSDPLVGKVLKFDLWPHV